MRFVVAQRNSRRGEGLGNEMFPWAKGWIASQALRAHLIGPAWGINRRRYYRNFRTSRLDFLIEDALLRLPHFDFTEKDYLGTGQTDFGAAISQWANVRGLTRRRSFAVSVGGMWGGYGAIRSARPFLFSRLFASRDALRNLYQVHSKLDRSKLFVAVHMRSGCEGFTTPTPGETRRGKFNILIPGDWYLWVCRTLKERFRDRIQFWFFTDRKNPDCEEAIRRFNPAQFTQSGLTECSDLLSMTLADLRVCSVSSYSLAANFLSDGPYVWHEPQLTLRDGFYTLWGSEEIQEKRASPTALSKEFVAKVGGAHGQGQSMPVNFLGVPMDIGDPLPEHLVELLEQRLRNHDSRTNLIEYGCVPQFLSRMGAHEHEQTAWSAGKGCS
jgi:hypothetical protein